MTKPARSTLGPLAIWGVLLVLTTATWWLSRLHLGAFSLPVAMGIATAKATLIVLFFMHLRHHPAASAIAGLVALSFLGLLISLVLGDVLQRFEPTRPPGPFIERLELRPPVFRDPSALDREPPQPKSR